MIRALWTAATGMTAQQANLDVISNNLANVNTTGFKKTRNNFQDLMYQTLRQAGASTGADTEVPTGIQIGHGVRQVATEKIYTSGNPQSTGKDLDVAIEGNGFFQITMADGTLAYTRDGSFTTDGQGRIVTADGYLLEPAMTVPDGTTQITISAEGIVTATLSDTTEELGQITLARFINPAGLSSVGHNLLKETVASGAPVVGNPGEDGAGKLLQQYLESSNVQVVEEMVNMIVAQRAYEINSKAITTADDMLEKAAALKR
ncbi:flagellar basal-body rod protein FlgG [Sporomusa acidovorans]|uniref:Flagellar basal-body rod protein FlgG n=1 Tax=Sporomusa acidovorans (strain ATCC 49682 / DSM 3132 / Mol) TaxID=1123286 RepID=A0ABZ3J752_SPOA4|nr:flagellar basal-body rod protein FlgG [Sporomusa acidovorans]OZC19268.1 flagellar basal-body rod protein FlgG [Sporomusa acidovorans DSM 3132]SDD82624.1 flagellar basal-body rod protein FlgG [Sporomusa acidovorans]